MKHTTHRLTTTVLQRYLFDGDKHRLYKRVVDAIRPHENENSIWKMMCRDQFVPAGNTLVAGVRPVTPNCSIIGTVSDENCEEKLGLFVILLTEAIGVGLDLSGCSDPVATLHRFAKAASEIKLPWHRPLRGCMATLSIEHTRIHDFMTCKYETGTLNIFNISVAIPDSFMRSPDNTLFDALCYYAHQTGDPGVVFIDRVQSKEYGEVEGRIVTSVPCGEQFMFDGETCTLGAMNLDAFVRDDGAFDFDTYRRSIRLAILFLDSVVDALIIPDMSMSKKSKSLRRVGLGVMGLATLLQTKNIPYESQESLDLSRDLASCLTKEADAESRRLGKLRGYHLHSTERRNITVTCLQPTGGIRLLTGNDGFSIEPLFREATQISPAFSVKMTATWQSHIENGTSKTINLPRCVTPREVREIYQLAYDMGCKGITVYRDGCKENQPIKLVYNE